MTLIQVKLCEISSEDVQIVLNHFEKYCWYLREEVHRNLNFETRVFNNEQKKNDFFKKVMDISNISLQIYKRILAFDAKY